MHIAKGLLAYWGSRDHAAGLTEFHRALVSLPNNTDTLYFIGAIGRRLGHIEESTRNFEEALKFDPQNASTVVAVSSNYEGAKRYTDAARVLDDALRWRPNDFGLASVRGGVDRNSRADNRRNEAILTSEAAKEADPDDVASLRMSLAFDQRDYHAAERALNEYKAPYLGSGGYNFPREFYQGIIQSASSNTNEARSAFVMARDKAVANLASNPDPKVLIVLGQTDAKLGRNEEASREGERALALLPPEKDALEAPLLLAMLAAIYAQIGERDRALETLERVVPMTYGPHYGDLVLNKDWDPLRGDLRFEKIVASLAPKDSK